MRAMLARTDLVAFLPCRDLEVADEFYGSGLGLPLVEASEFARVYDANGTQLRVTRVDSPARAPYTALGWSVADIEAAISALEARGIELNRYEGMDQDAAGVWIAPGGTKVAWFGDPDGNTISVSQAP
jgi:catechol 2,3-dioxygenase-like lactoylglutathione lyase family enzyme